MSTVQRIFHVLDALEIDQKTFAEEIGTTNKVVSKWKTGSLKSYQKYLREIVDYLNIPPDYFLEQGVFSNWDSILKYPLSVCNEIRKHIPKGYIDASFDPDTYLEAWLDIRMCYGITGENEVDLIRWFYRNIAEVSIKKENHISESISPAQVQITFIEYRFGPFKNEKPTPVSEGEPLSPPGYRLLSPANKAIIDQMVAILLENQQSTPVLKVIAAASDGSRPEASIDLDPEFKLPQSVQALPDEYKGKTGGKASAPEEK